MQNQVREISSTKDFQDLLHTTKTLLVVDFFAQWCGPCKIMAPIFDQIAQEFPSVVFAKVDVDALGDLASEYNISSIPTLVYFKNGAVAQESVGASAKSQITSTILKHLK